MFHGKTYPMAEQTHPRPPHGGFPLVVCALLTGVADRAAGQSPGRFEHLRQMLPAEAHVTSALALGDVDGDGDLDLVVGNRTSDTMIAGPTRLHLNDGDGRFVAAPAALPVDGGSDTRALALGDVDGDGDLDLVLGNGGQDSLYLNDGAGIFADATATQLPLDGTLDTFAVALGDVDGDGDRDLLLGTGGQDRLYLNDGTGFFIDATAALLPVASEDTRALALGDVDGDGDQDLLLGTHGQDRLYLNDGAGSFTDATATRLPTVVNATNSLSLGDVDGDGDPDLVIGGGRFVVTWKMWFPAPEPQRLFLNDGAGYFSDATATHMPPASQMTSEVVLLDADLDGDLDLAIGNFWGDGILEMGPDDRLYRNDGTGHFVDDTAATLPAQSEPTAAVAAGDVDGDGDPDLVLGRCGWRIPCSGDACGGGEGGGGQNRLLLNDSAGAFADATAPYTPAVEPRTTCLALGDVDADGDLDLALGATAFLGFEVRSRLYLNGGPGDFRDVTATHLPPTSEPPQALALGDVDGDGDLDLVIAAHEGQNGLYLNDGSGVFGDVTATNMPADQDFTNAIVLDDLDGDGDRDLVFGNRKQQNRLYVNDGSGVFHDATAALLPADSDYTFSLALGDVDGDGDADLVVGNGGQDRLYLNDGAGAFTDWTATHMPMDADRTDALALGDVDGDGDPDLVLGELGQDRLFLNAGGGVFTDATTGRMPADAAPTNALALLDADDDGDLDIALATWGQNRLYLNDGTGTFLDRTAQHLPLDEGPTTALVAGDVDGDADPDLVIGDDWDPVRVLTNLTRQLAWRASPRVGKPLTMDVYGPPSAPWTAVTWRTVGGIGYASTGQPFASGSLDPDGRASFTLQVPASPALVGVPWSWRARVGGRSTNVEVTTFADL